MMRSRLLLVFALLCVHCAESTPPAAAPKPPVATDPNAVATFLPLKDNTTFAYDTRSDLSGAGMLVMQVRRPRAQMAELVVAGRVRRLDIDDTGVRHAAGGWLLKPPLAQGAQFQGDFGTVQITGLSKHVEVPAGKFDGCLETTESLAGTGFSKRTVTQYCPHVGIVARQTDVESEEGAGSESLTLRSFGERTDLSAQ